MALRNMYDQFLDEFDGRLDDIVTFFIFVIMIIPMDDIGLFIKTDDAAFSDAGPAGITHIVGNACVDVVAVIFVFKFFIFFLGPGIDIKAFGMFFVQDDLALLKEGPIFSSMRRNSSYWKVFLSLVKLKWVKNLKESLSGE